MNALRRLVRSIADTADAEISCAECFELLPKYAELEAAGPVSEPGLAGMAQHLAQCGVCREEADVLRALARAEG